MLTGTLLRAGLAASAALLLASCSFAPAPGVIRSKEYFAQAKYGPASPRMVAEGPVPKGGGVYRIGRPYQVAGKTYIPRDNPRYSATGTASWYGSAFHGRLTANGEVYDVNALTAAHPTMPLPSYARVTNLRNGRSIVVRVNDRGPFADNRIIDVSSAAADRLGFKQAGTAQVKVDYVGPARMDGLDHKMLLASYHEPGLKVPFVSPPRPAASYAVAALPAPRVRQPEYGAAVANAGPLVLTPAYASAPASAFAPAPAYDPLAPLILKNNTFRSYAEEPQLAPAQRAAADLSASDLTAALNRAAAKKAGELAAARAAGTKH